MDVLPWLFDETENFLEEMRQAEALPTQLIDGFIDEMAQTHTQTIAGHTTRRNDSEQAARKAEEVKREAKLQRRAAREAVRKAEELAKLREKIKEEFISQGKTEEGIIFQDLIDIDGFGRKEEKVVGVIGGFLGQLIMVLNTVSKHYSRLDLPVKSRVPDSATVNEHVALEVLWREHTSD